MKEQEEIKVCTKCGHTVRIHSKRDGKCLGKDCDCTRKVAI